MSHVWAVFPRPRVFPPLAPPPLVLTPAFVLEGNSTGQGAKNL